MTSPIQRIPYDILREILLYDEEYAPSMGFDEPSFDIKVLEPPITASHVCRSWRHALLSDSTMWTGLVIHTMKPDGIMELLRRSGSASLTVLLQLNWVCELGDRSETLIMLFTLFKQIHRFNVLRVQLDLLGNQQLPFSAVFDVSVELIMVSFQQPAPRLQTFSFSYGHLENSTYNPKFAAIANLFSGNAPNLKRVHHRLSREFRKPCSDAFNNISDFISRRLVVCTLFLSLIFWKHPLSSNYFILSTFFITCESPSPIHLPIVKYIYHTLKN